MLMEDVALVFADSLGLLRCSLSCATPASRKGPFISPSSLSCLALLLVVRDGQRQMVNPSVLCSLYTHTKTEEEKKETKRR